MDGFAKVLNSPKLLINRSTGNTKMKDGVKKRFFKDRGCRKRSKSFSGSGIINSKPVPPTKFLLGGNINDPLNLGSLQNADINRALNTFSPKCSPLPTPPRRKLPIEVIVSPNTHDPLHLMDCVNEKDYEEQLSSPVKKGKKKRFKKRRTMSASAEGCVPDHIDNIEAKTPEASMDSAKIPEDPENIKIGVTVDNLQDKPKKKTVTINLSNGPKKFKNTMDKIVSPVVPQPGAWLKRSISTTFSRPPQNKVKDQAIPLFKEKNKRFQYGNYNRYYGYRNPNNEVDYRLKVFGHHSHIFENKDILDVGCNIGHITLSVARDLNARTVTGVDIDPKLISIARKNIRYYVKTSLNSPARMENVSVSNRATCKSNRFHDIQGTDFPKNVTFKQCNYVPEDESLLCLEQPQFDVILCLSITKWIHLNWGDKGIKLTFRRMFEQLRPGGKLILEPQHWASYKSKRNLTETIYQNYKSIDFFPDKFSEYLLSPAVGFAKSEILGYPYHKSAGFRRPIQVFTKSTTFLPERSERCEAAPSTEHDMQSDEVDLESHIEKHVYASLTRSNGRFCEDSQDHSPSLSCQSVDYSKCSPDSTTADTPTD
ncbi:7SK snRNA methylphosphate capping enzyme bin3 isoform X2 [Dendroctonus ponderosae]|uniref:RNA methyltransferase n=1 Tax=Dendroctonus ponderosae TaxID=77166 RepID=A0AAR5QJ66_DENPD|nr:7SK snRNA methylphosphate capping enzyme bin3 isoform X2 [Dendroctonus ponderosae]